MESNDKAHSAESFVAALRTDLLAGKYSPGEWLKQADLERDYGANRFEVRLGLAELSVRGLLEHIRNHGYRVCNHTDLEREQIYEVRTLVEVAASRLVVQRATDEQIAEFERLVTQFDESIEAGGLVRLQEINFRLHRCMYMMTGNPILANQIRELRERGVSGRKGAWDTPLSLRESSEDHRGMLEMLKRRDAEGLSAVVYRHLNRWRSHPVRKERDRSPQQGAPLASAGKRAAR